MSFRVSSTPSDRHRGVDQDDDGYNHVKAPPLRDDVDDSFVEQFRSYSPISLTSEDDGAKPPSVPKRDNLPEELCRMVSFGSLELSEPHVTVRVLNDTDDDSSAHQEKSVCSSVETMHVSNMAHFSSSRTFKASNATKEPGTQVVEQANVSMSRNERKANRLKDLLLVPTVPAIAGEQVPDLQHDTNAHGDGVGTVSETEYKLEPRFTLVDEIDVGTSQIQNEDAKLTKNLLYPTTAAVAGAQESIVQHQTNELGDLPCTAPETEYIFEPDVECPSKIIPHVTEATIPAMDVESHGENLNEPGLRVANEEELFSDEAVGQERKFFRTPVHKKWCLLAVFAMSLALCACSIVVVVVVLVGRAPTGSSSSLASPSTVAITTSSPTSTPTGTPTTASATGAHPTTTPMTAAPTNATTAGTPTTPDPQTVSPTTTLMTAAPTTHDSTPDPQTVPPTTTLMTAAPTTHDSTPDPQTGPPTTTPITGAPTTPDATAVPSALKPISSLTPVEIACNFLSISNVTVCRSTFVFDSWPDADKLKNKTNGSTIPSEIGLLTQLTFLDLWGNSLTSTIPSEIGLLTQLTYLAVESNSLTSTVPSEIGLLTQLTELSFYDNALTSTIPGEIGLLTQLMRLSFASNSLTSTIPSEIGLLTQLMGLSFASNSLTSTIPSEIGLLTQLTSLDFYNNELTSTIPGEIGLLTQLMGLSFASNSLTSTIPSEIGLLTQLTSLDFESNELQGTIPSSLCSLPSLVPDIVIDCGEITCASGCCYGSGNHSCG